MVIAMPAEAIKKTASRRYSDGHLWLEPLNGLTYVGLTKLAIEELGEINFVELPMQGQTIKKDDVLFVLESNKASHKRAKGRAHKAASRAAPRRQAGSRRQRKSASSPSRTKEANTRSPAG